MSCKLNSDLFHYLKQIEAELALQPKQWHGKHWIRDTTRERIYKRDEYKCVYCEKNLKNTPEKDITLDHLKPRSKMGSNDPSNLITCCKHCNFSRQHMPFSKFIDKVADQTNQDVLSIARRIRNCRSRKLPVIPYEQEEDKMAANVQGDTMPVQSIVKKLAQAGHKDLAKEILSMMYKIGDRGLQPAETGKILIQPNTEYYLGASSSPDHIIVTKADDNYISYVKYPYFKELRIEREIGEDLIYTGVNTWVEKYGAQYPKDAAKFKKLLAGKKVPTVNYKDFQAVTVKVKIADPTKTDKDLWDTAVRYGGVGYNRQDKLFLINTNRGRLDDIKKDKNFEFVSIEDDLVSANVQKEPTVTQSSIFKSVAKKLVAAGHFDVAKEVLALQEDPPEEPTVVVFRKFKEGDIIAFFPYESGTNDPATMMSYQHVGQHNSASMDLIRSTLPVKPEEYKDLKKELERIGYKLIVKNKIPSDAYRRRRDAIDKFYSKATADEKPTFPGEYKGETITERGSIKGPGKFEGEMWYVLDFYDAIMNGERGDNEFSIEGWDSSWDGFILTPEDKKRYDLQNVYAVILHEGTQGFVGLEEVSSKHDYDKFWADLEKEYPSDEEEAAIEPKENEMTALTKEQDDLLESIVLIAENNFPDLYKTKDAKTAVDRAVREYRTTQWENLKEILKIAKAKMVADLPALKDNKAGESFEKDGKRIKWTNKGYDYFMDKNFSLSDLDLLEEILFEALKLKLEPKIAIDAAIKSVLDKGLKTLKANIKAVTQEAIKRIESDWAEASAHAAVAKKLIAAGYEDLAKEVLIMGDWQTVENLLRDMFQAKQYNGKVPSKDMEIVLRSPRWHKMAGGKQILQEVWQGLIDDGFVKQDGNFWIWQ